MLRWNFQEILGIYGVVDRIFKTMSVWKLLTGMEEHKASMPSKW